VKPYELFDHPADIGLRIYGRNLEELFTHAARGLTDLMTDVQKDKFGLVIKASEHEEICLHEESVSDLLFSWLRELLYLFSAKKLIFQKYQFDKLNEKELVAHAAGEFFDPERHEQRVEVKAVTYHQFSVKKTRQGWQAQVIFDI